MCFQFNPAETIVYIAKCSQCHVHLHSDIINKKIRALAIHGRANTRAAISSEVCSDPPRNNKYVCMELIITKTIIGTHCLDCLE